MCAACAASVSGCSMGGVEALGSSGAVSRAEMSFVVGERRLGRE